MHSLRTLLTTTALAATTACALTDATDPAVGVSANNAGVFPGAVALPFSPEGIAIGNGTTSYAGNLTGTAGPLGAIYRGDLRTGVFSILYPGDTRPVLGLKYDSRSRLIFAARGSTGRGTVIDESTGTAVTEFIFAPAPTFINDVIVTRDAAYFTDSQRPQLYRVPLGAAGELVGGFAIIPLSGDWVQTGTTHCGGANPNPTGVNPGFNANGIVATPDGSRLLVNNLRVGTVYLVDPATGNATEVDLAGGNVCYADGMLLAGHTLYVVQNLLSRVAVIQLSPDYASGVIARYIQHTHPITTLARHGSALYAVTAGFGFLAPFSQPWELVRLGM